jgi:replicative DNA helicase Mcm
MVITSDNPPVNPTADFKDFFRTFEDIPNEFKYRRKISEAYASSQDYIVVLFEDILNFDVSLANYLRNNPEQALLEATESFKDIMRFDAGGDFQANRDYFVRISTNNNSNEIKLRELRAANIDKLLYVKGIIIRSSMVRPQIINATFECPVCGNVMQELQSASKLTVPNECTNPNCNNKRDFVIKTDESEFIDYQTVTIQEAPEELRAGAIPQTYQAVLLHDLVDSVRPGERVKITGIFKSVPKEDGRGKISTVFYTNILVNYIEGLKQQDDEVDITPEDLEEIRAISQEPMIQKKIARSIARAILGHEHLKMAAALSLFGGNQKLKKDGSKLRGDIHVLFMGDPGTGKSQILQNCAQIASRSVYTSGKGASAAGLTAAVIKESDSSGMQLEAGALVLASGGIACIDEFDKMKTTDRVAIHEAMEQQSVSIAKAGIVATLQAKTAIIAAANPKAGRWNDYATPSENINLSPPILSRFDLIFVVRDIPEKNTDDRIADYILKNHMAGFDETYESAEDDSNRIPRAEDFIPMELLKKYLRHVRNICHPKLTRETAKRIHDFYVDLRGSGGEGSTAVNIVARNLDGLIRMSEAYAKMAMRDFVNLEDVDAIIDLYHRYTRDIGYDVETGSVDMDRLLTGTSTNKRQKFTIILNKIRELQDENPKTGFPVEDIYVPLAEIEGISEEFVKEALIQWVKEGTLYNPKPHLFKMINGPKSKK